YVPNQSQTITVSSGKTSSVSFYNILKKFRVIVTKQDYEKGHAQGDAKLSGAVYGLFKGNDLVAQYTTDQNGSFTTDYYVCGKDWTIKEIAPSEGYLLNDTVYKVGADPKDYTVEYNNAPDMTVMEQVIKGKISIIKHTDDGETQIETPEKGAEFQIYLKSSGSFVNADKDERDTIICDQDGFASTKLLPYGVYTVHQTKGWDGREKITDFDVFINTDGKTYKFLINNKNFESYLKVVKLDKETGKQIAYEGAAFEIYDSDNHRVTMQYTYPQVTSIHTFYTNKEGYLITPEKLPYGDYTLKEVQAPYGYVLDDTPIPFSISQENSSTDTGVTVVKVKARDVAQKGVINITKTGEIFSSVEENNGVYTPKYSVGNLKGAVFEVYAAEDITTLDGTVRYEQGTLVDTITTDDDGVAKSKELYLGKYTVIEKTAPNGYVHNAAKYDAELTYAGQNVSVTSTDISVYNDRQKVSVSLKKEMEEDKTFNLGKNNEISSVQFGVYANEDIKASNGDVIPKDALITFANCDKNGSIVFDCDLPVGFKWYLKEIATDAHYILSDTKYEFDTEYQGQDVKVIDIKVNNDKAIENNLIYGSVKGLKVDRETQEVIKGATFGLFKSDTTEFTEDKAILTAVTDENGVFVFNNIPYGEYLIKELKPADGYLDNEDVFTVTIKDNEQVVELNAINDKVPELKTTATVNGKKEAVAKGETTIKDTVEYKHLVPNTEYVIKGTLMDKSTGKPFMVKGKEVTSTVKFTPDKANGTVEVEFTFDASNIKKSTDLVVFESLYRDNVEIAVHADLKDKGQTVTIVPPAPKTPKTSDNRNLGTWIGLGGVGLGAGIAALLLKLKMKKDEDE
ncbi:MAG: SpaA isopeptide-forming pilin-related protein, partial [Eubacterium sp.]